MKKIGVICYVEPHRKTFDVLTALKLKGYNDVIVSAKKMHYKKKFKPIISHRPEVIWPVTTKMICDRLNFEYYEEEINSNILEEGSNVLISGSGIIPTEILQNYNVINAHPGFLPFTRGLDSLKWSILEDKIVGVTLHIIGEKPDTGLLIERFRFQPFQNTFYELSNKVYEKEIKMLIDSATFTFDRKNMIYLPDTASKLKKRMKNELEIKMIEKYNNKYITFLKSKIEKI